MRLALAAVLALAFVGCAGRPPASPRPEPPDVVEVTPDGAPIVLRRSIVADQYFWLRAKALEGEAPAPFAEALAAMRELRADLEPDPTAWEDLEVPLGSVRHARELTEAYAALPPMIDVDGAPVPLRARALRLARALEATEAAYKAGPFREHEAELARAASELSARLVPRLGAIFGSVETELSVPALSPVVVTLVADAPFSGGFAADARGHASASFVRVGRLDAGALCETVLHETLHAMDELTVRFPTVLNMLRAALTRRGVDASDPNLEMAMNTVTFAEAASLVRRHVDPAHRPLGEGGFYALYPAAPAIVEAWERHVGGQGLDETSDAIARAVTSP